MNTLPLIIAKQSIALNTTMLGFAAGIVVGVGLMLIGFGQLGYFGNKPRKNTSGRALVVGVLLTGFCMFGALISAGVFVVFGSV